MRNGGELKMKTEINAGDYVRINEAKLDKIVQQFLNEFKNRLAVRWEGYRNLAFLVIGVDENNLIILQDNDNNKIHISRKSLEIVNIPGS